MRPRSRSQAESVGRSGIPLPRGRQPQHNRRQFAALARARWPVAIGGSESYAAAYENRKI